VPKPGGYGRPSLSPDGRRLAMEVTDGSGQDIWVYALERRRGVDKMNRINQFACPRHTLIRTHMVFVGFMQLVILTYTPKRRRIVSQSMMRRVKQIKQDRWLGAREKSLQWTVTY
jgi:hypothetical protein